jgi:hypothetical protein
MEFNTSAQSMCYGRVARLMKQLFGEAAYRRRESPSFSLVYGTARVDAYVTAWGDDDALVKIRAFVITDIDSCPELLEFLLRQNAEPAFGSFGLDEDGDITLDAALVARACDRATLRAIFMAVAERADEVGPQIAARWGGETFRARLSAA